MNITFDGDTASLMAVYTDESLEEISRVLKRKRAYFDPRGGLLASAATDTVNLVLKSLTGPGRSPK